ARLQNFEIQFLKEAAKFVGDFKSLANEADASFAKHKALELEIKRLVKAVVSQDIIIIMQIESVVYTSDLQTKLERIKERFENCIIKKETEYAKLWNDWYKKCDECKYDKISYDKAYKDMQQKIKRLQAQLGDLKGKSKDTSCVSDTRNPLSQKLKNENVELEFQVLNYAKENAHLKATYKNLFDSISVSRNLKLLINFVWKFMGNVRFGNDHIAAILGFGDLQRGNILITRVYFVEGLGHNLFLAGQFRDSDLEVAFRRDACFVRNLEHLCPSCEQGKSKRASHPPKSVPNSRQRLHLLHMDLCGPMRIVSINGKRYVLVIMDDYSRYMWVHFLRSKDEAPEVIIKFLKRITVLLQSPVIIIRTDNGIEFKNQVLKEYFDTVGISHQMSSVRTPQQNRVVERRYRTLVEAARTMLIFYCVPLFLWAEAIATVCFTQNRSIIHRRFNKTPYELINDRKLDISFLHVFGVLCYPKNNREDIGKLGAKGDIGFFIGYSADSCAYRVYNRRTKKIMETMNVSFDELSAMVLNNAVQNPGFKV
nr:integrase, catalytic region, zinc finger, CCHC-type, peptidase aspartic, catalytic [Tanacetum cinerariifolium]